MQWCNPLTLQSEQSGRVGSIPGRSKPATSPSPAPIVLFDSLRNDDIGYCKIKCENRIELESCSGRIRAPFSGLSGLVVI